MKKIIVIFVLFFITAIVTKGSWNRKIFAQSTPITDDPSIFWIAPQQQRFTWPCEYSGNTDCMRDLVERLGSNTQRNVKIGVTVVSWYLASTSRHVAGFMEYGKDNDWHFQPKSYDLDNTTSHRSDNLQTAYNLAQRYNWNIFVDLAGEPWGEWIDCDDPLFNQKDPGHEHDRCSSVNNNVATFLEKDNNNVQWDQFNQPGKEDYNHFPPMQRTLSLSPYKTTVNNYIKRNLQEAVRWVWDNPDRRSRTLGFAVDADGFLMAWGDDGKYYDYNPDSVRQFRNWLLCRDIYADGAQYTRFRRPTCLGSVAEVNSTFGKNFADENAIDPPRPTGSFASWPSEARVLDTWWREWTKFRQYQVLLYQWQKLKWVEEAGVPANMIYGYHGLTKFDATKANDFAMGRDIYAATMEGAGPAPYGMGVSLYHGDAINDDNLFLQRIKNQNANWISPETNPSGVDYNATPVTYDHAFLSLHQAFLYNTKLLAPVAWHVPYFEGGAQSAGISKVRDTAYEDAIRDFVTTYGKYPRGSMAWEFGVKSTKCMDKTGITKKPGTTVACEQADQIDHTNLEAWTATNQLKNPVLSDGTATFTVDGVDPYFTSPDNLSYQTKQTDHLKVRLKFDSSENVTGQVYWANPDWGITSVDFPITADGQWHEYDIPVGQHGNWRGTIRQFRIDPGSNDTSLVGKRVSFDSIWLSDVVPIATPTPTPMPTPIMVIPPGDMDGNGRVNVSDYHLLVDNFDKTGSPGWVPWDIFADGKVDIFDYNILVGNFGK